MRSLMMLSVLLGAAAADAAVLKVSITGLKFVPDVVQARAGDTIEFTNESNFVHTVTADPTLVKNPANVVLPAGAAPFHSGKLLPGKTFTQTLTVPGLYQYVCLPHELHGMQGQIEVLPLED